MKKQNGFWALLPMALFVLILFCILLLVQLGSSLYAALAGQRQEQNARRASLSYLAQQLRNADETGAVSLEQSPDGGTMLVLAEPLAGTGCVTRIYLHEGNLVEEYRPADTTPDPTQAQAVTQTKAFDVQMLEDGLVQLTTGEGQMLVCLHSEETAP